VNDVAVIAECDLACCYVEIDGFAFLGGRMFQLKDDQERSAPMRVKHADYADEMRWWL